MKKFFFNKVTDFMERRQSSIEEKINQANINFDKANEMLLEYDKKLSEIRKTTIINRFHG